MSERRRLNSSMYGMVSTDLRGYQVVCNLLRGTQLMIDKDERGRTVVSAEGKQFLPRGEQLRRLMRISSPAK